MSNAVPAPPAWKSTIVSRPAPAGAMRAYARPGSASASAVTGTW